MKATCKNCKRRIRIHKSRNIQCPGCGHEFNASEYFDTNPVYLVDTNIILYAINKDRRHGDICQGVFNSGMSLGTCDTCIAEIVQDIPYKLKVYKVKKMSPFVSELKATTLKQPSPVDLTLLQASIDNPEIKGIITFDNDFKRIASAGVVSRGQFNFWVGNAYEFIQKKVKKTYR